MTGYREIIDAYKASEREYWAEMKRVWPDCDWREKFLALDKYSCQVIDLRQQKSFQENEEAKWSCEE